MSNLANLIEALCHRLEDGLAGQEFEGLKAAAVLEYRIERQYAKSKLDPYVVVAPAGIGSGWHHDGSHPYASAGIAVLVYPGSVDRKAGRFRAAQAFSDLAHKILQDAPVPFVWPEPPAEAVTHVLSIRLESGPDPVVVEGTDWPAMSRLYNVNANVQEAYA